MCYTQYPSYVATALLFSLLLHGCQSQMKLNGLGEDAPSAASPKPGGKQQGSSEALIPTLGSSTPKTSDEQGDAKPPAKRKRGDEDDTKLPAKRPFLDLDAKLVELNEKENKSGRGREWVLGPPIQLPSSEGEHTCAWDIPEGYSFFTHKLIGNNTDDAKIVIGHNRDNYSCVGKSSFKKYKSNEGQVSVSGQEGVPSEATFAHNSTNGQEEEKVASRNNASLTITVSRKAKIGDELLSGHNRKYDCDAGLLEIQILLCLEKTSGLGKSPTIYLQAAHKALKEKYSNPSFSLVKSLFPGEPPKYVDALTCTLQLIEVNDKQKTFQDAQDGADAHHDRSQREKTTIVPAELFSQEAKSPARSPVVFRKY